MIFPIKKMHLFLKESIINCMLYTGGKWHFNLWNFDKNKKNIEF